MGTKYCISVVLIFGLSIARAQIVDLEETVHRLARTCEQASTLLERVNPEGTAGDAEASWLCAGLNRYIGWLAARETGLISEQRATAFLLREAADYLEDMDPEPSSTERLERRGFLALLALDALLADAEGPSLVALLRTARMPGRPIGHDDLIHAAESYGLTEIAIFIQRCVRPDDQLPLEAILVHGGLSL